jgi:hypothetical protein
MPWHRPLRALIVTVAAAPLLAATARAEFVFRTIDAPGAVADTQVTGITAAGVIVGYADYGNGNNRGFIATPNGTGGFTFVQYVAPNVNSTFINGINGSGQLVGSVDVSGDFFGFLGSTSSSAVTPLNFGNAALTFAYGINDAGVAVGHFTAVGANNALTVSGFVRSADGATVTPLQVPGASGETQAFGIGPDGTVVGNYRDANFNFRGFLATPGPGGSYSFSTLDVPGAQSTTVHGINGLGQLVGSYFLPGSNNSRGFLATPFGSTYTFSDLIHPDAVNGTYALGLNGAGTVVGFYFDANNNSHGFIATAVPAPPSLVLAAVGALALGGRRAWRRRG